MYWVGFYWLIGTMVRFGFIAVPLSVFLRSSVWAMVYGWGFAWWLRRTERSTYPWWVRLLLPACTYVAFDYLYPRVFPWYLGFLQLPGLPFIQIADVAGVHGVTFVLVVCNTVVAAFVPHPGQPERTVRRLMGLGCAGLLLLQSGYGFWRMPQLTAAMQQAPPLRVALIQPDIGMYEKHSGADREAQLDLHFGLSATTLDQYPELIIWPESMYPFGVSEHMQQLPWPAVPAPHNVHWLIGALTYAGKGPARQVFNSALLLDQDGRILGRYDKQHLLALGNIFPCSITCRFAPYFAHHWQPYTRPGVVTLPKRGRSGPLICYEDIVPDLARQAVRQGAQVLVNLTNDVWFGATRAPYQHRALAAFRTVENRVYLVRVTNTGLTSIIDALGREQAALPIFQADTLVHTIQPLRLASLYTRFGDWFAQLCSAVALLLLLGNRLRRRRRA
jgi:apolipoprotein N-acyltransferase